LRSAAPGAGATSAERATERASTTVTRGAVAAAAAARVAASFVFPSIAVRVTRTVEPRARGGKGEGEGAAPRLGEGAGEREREAPLEGLGDTAFVTFSAAARENVRPGSAGHVMRRTARGMGEGGGARRGSASAMGTAVFLTGSSLPSSSWSVTEKTGVSSGSPARRSRWQLPDEAEEEEREEEEEEEAQGAGSAPDSGIGVGVAPAAAAVLFALARVAAARPVQSAPVSGTGPMPPSHARMRTPMSPPPRVEGSAAAGIEMRAGGSGVAVGAGVAAAPAAPPPVVVVADVVESMRTQGARGASSAASERPAPPAMRTTVSASAGAQAGVGAALARKLVDSAFPTLLP
jgi:hypothetical protein